MTIQVKTNDKAFILVAVFKSPGTPLLTADLDDILNSGQNIIIGNLNAKHKAWNSKSTNMAGKALLRYMDTRLESIVTAPTSPTRYPTHPNQTPDFLDITIIKAGGLGYYLENLPSELSSDNSSVLIDTPPRASPPYFTDWQKYEV